MKIGDRRAHYLRAGDGAPVVLIHSSPSSAETLRPLITRLSENFTCFAFDTPGFGSSDALAGDDVDIADLADALADNLRALGLTAAAVFGTHTGAAIALELAVRHPELVSGLIVDGLPLFTTRERDLFEGYFAPLVVDLLGGHYAHTWTRFRDQSIWFPWTSRSPGDLNPYDLATPEKLHLALMNFFRCAGAYAPAYRSAIWFGARAASSLRALSVPAVFTALSTDMLCDHLGRIPPLKAGQEIVRLGADPEALHQLIAAQLAAFSGPAPAPADANPLVNGRGFVDLVHGQMFVRMAGDAANPPLVLLHDAPGSGQRLEPLIDELAQSFHVCAPDLPGCGESDPLPEEAPDLARFAAVIESMCEVLGLDNPNLYGLGAGASLAAETARRFPFRVEALLLGGVLLPDTALRSELQQRYAPAIDIDSLGGHWFALWHQLRDSLVYWPWYSRRLDSQRKVAADFDGQTLHDWTLEVMKQRGAYRQLLGAVLAHDAAAALGAVAVRPKMFSGSASPFSVFDAQFRKSFANVEVIDASADAEAHARQIIGALQLRALTTNSDGRPLPKEAAASPALASPSEGSF